MRKNDRNKHQQRHREETRKNEMISDARKARA